MYAVAAGNRYVYEFIVDNRAGTYWFHPHPHERTGFQVYHGLAGFLLVGDDEEDALKLPRGMFDLPLVIQDRAFDSRNQLVYLQSMMDRMMGFMGERVLVDASRITQNRSAQCLPDATAQRLECDGLPDLLKQWPAIFGHRHRRWPPRASHHASDAHARCRRACRCLGGFRRGTVG